MSHHEDNPEYSVHHRKEIASILENLRKERTAIGLRLDSGEGFITCVVAVNLESNLVYLDVSRDERLNTKITHSKKLTFSTQGGIMVKWHSAHASLVSLPDGNAISVHLPAVLQRIQRREYFRVNVPGSKGMVCRIPVADEIFEAPVKDMSAGGLGLQMKGPLSDVFSQGSILEGCSIDFPVVGKVAFKLMVRSVRSTGMENTYHVGTEFMDLSRGASNVIQRHIIELEGEQIVA